MTVEAWIIFALFWLVFVTTPGPNAVNCISNGMALGFRRSLPAILGILTQACLSLALSAFGVAALVATSPTVFTVAKYLGAGFLIYMGVRGWIMASVPVTAQDVTGKSVYLRAFAIATINPKSVAGYFAAFTQFVQPDTPIGPQMWVIVPTALMLTTLSYSIYTTLGVALGRTALRTVFNTAFRRALAVCFVIYGVLLGSAAAPGRG